MSIRTLLALTFALAGTAALAGCRSEDELKAEYRTGKSRECLDSLRQDPNSAMLDAERFCGCVLDRQMAGKSANELEKFAPTAQQKQEWGVQCADASLRPGALGRPVAPPAQPPAKGGEEAAAEAPKEE